MEENTPPAPQEQPKKQRSTFRKIVNIIFLKIKKLAALSSDTDVEMTIHTITKSVDFRGANLWILAFATLIASIGLDVNSIPVIIGAMLISPLMGPINGVGLAIGITDSELLRRSLTNFCLMVGVSLIASTLYFLISPLSDAQSELLARTRPTIFDVMIALVGGLSGIVAISRKEQSFTVISGVAIATALMPPLCTAGFGLATGQMNFFLGAFYLFFLNSFFIALGTYIVVRLLKFPHRKYMDPQRSKKVTRYVTVFTILAMVPSIILAFNVIRETAFNNNAIRFINEIQECPIFERTEIINTKKEYKRDHRYITLSLVGQPLSEKDVELLEQMKLKNGLTKTELRLKQTTFLKDSEMESVIVENILDRKERQIANKDSLIRCLEEQILVLQHSSGDYEKVAKEIAIQYKNANIISISNMAFTNTATMTTETQPAVYIQWKKKPTKTEREQLVNWLKLRLETDTMRMIED
ncbi:TIGR00341 family protein [Bacteroidales bacterium OttesenSCG-928-B11]|nr:TIGR00341 family protein [Bacteroidales bacterium OttesenSCG-928-C03]MDL2312709.1 TIGR00341 family protein [Bacteroidales bacterium OttesenSCG-928-B11]MDL2326269.1 TIGR00341 family protein [Bacteroidales bacterium OttesenSCG-928-A14]